MFNLIVKDFLLQKKLIYFALGYGSFLFFAFRQPILNHMIYSVGSIAIAYILFMSVIASEDKNNSNIILNSLPIKKSWIVYSKYIVLLSSIFLSLLIMGTLGAIFKVIAFFQVQRYIGIYDLVVTFITVSLLGSLYYPLYLKLGPKYIKFLNMVMFIALFTIPGLIGEIMEKNNFSLGKKLVQFMQNTPHWFLIILVIVVTCLVLMVSSKISSKIYKNKEF